jgi:hypothetical protein
MKNPPDENTYKRLAIIIVTLCLATGAVAQTETMQEQGFTPGMTEEQLRQQLKDKGAECTSGYIDGGINCRINGEEVAFASRAARPVVSALSRIYPLKGAVSYRPSFTRSISGLRRRRAL